MFDAVIFDWDGTLADTHSFVVNSFQKALISFGCKIDDEFIKRRIGIGARNTIKEALQAANMPLDESVIDQLVEQKIEAQMEQTEVISLFEGAYEVLSSLKAKVKMALATMNNRAVIDKLLAERGLKPYFNVVITVDEVVQPKPDPEIFLKCAINLRCHPRNCVVLEDSVYGIEAAKKAKMKCIAIPTGAFTLTELERQKPDLIVTSLRKTEEILNFVLC
ncbi:MAG: HAD family phosphatase [Candidatus Bathyarchaeota archaeon]|nr:MAG: HAD family phosphatase [Candidatus Bathyarchaeota archaeon]